MYTDDSIKKVSLLPWWSMKQKLKVSRVNLSGMITYPHQFDRVMLAEALRFVFAGDRKHRMYVGWMINITHRHHICCSVWSEKSIKCSEKAATFNTRVKQFSIVKWIITCDTIWVLPLFLRCPDWDTRLTVRKWVGSFLVIWSCWKENVWCTHMLGKNHILLNEQ